MAGGFFDIVLAQDATAATREQQAENGSRWAVSQHTVESRGNVSARLTEPLVFESPFYDPPFIMTGMAIKKDMAPGTDWVPNTSAGVYQWQRNTKGHYTGAFVFVTAMGVEAFSEIQHHLLFSGIAYKNLGQEVAAEAQTLPVRPVGFGGL